MDKVITFTVLIATLIAVDAPYLYFSRGFYTSELENVQQSELQAKLAPLPVIYALLALSLLLFVIIPNHGKSGYIYTTILGMLLGGVIYGVYNLTNYATLSRYSWRYVLRDTAWGTILFALVTMVGKYTYMKVAK